MKTNNPQIIKKEITPYLKAILDFIFPPVCHLCDSTLTPDEKYVCHSCLAALPRTSYHRIPNNPLEQRLAGHFNFERATAIFFYSRGSRLSKLIQDFKYNSFPGLARYLGEYMAFELYNTGFLSDIDCILPIPMHKRKRWKRGYNQAQMLAEGIAKETNIPLFDNLISKKGHKSQTAFSHDERFANIANTIALRKPEQLSCKHILLVDDVCTTGATISAAAKLINDSAPDAKISVLTLGTTF